MKAITHVIFLFFAGLLTTFSNAQDAFDNLRINRSVLRYYNGNDITDLMELATDKYELLSNYFIHSYIVTSTECKACEVNMNDFYNYELFNIVEFESSRAQNSEVVLMFKDKYKVVLKSIDDLNLLLDGHSPDEMLFLRASRPLPNLMDTGDLDNDFRIYQVELVKWITDFPDEYRTITTGTTLLRISISDFTDLSLVRREAVLTHSDGYIITD